ncbi:MAG: hypothetical protein GY859_01990, partial [Desulfobacterales bacterium]|nr:hypothetical protein [Desulfobacterales bacterium]
LEYLDAILRGGEARFTDVTRRLSNAIREKSGIDDPGRWCENVSGDLDRALAETVTIAADEVLMDDLLETAKKTPMATDLLVGASVYRRPVVSLALAWQVGEEIEIPPDPERDKRLAKVQEAIENALAEGKEPTPDNLGHTPEEMLQFKKDMEEKGRPPINAPDGVDNALKVLLDLSLLSLVKYTEDQLPRFMVHRWTAGAMESRFPKDM